MFDLGHSDAGGRHAKMAFVPSYACYLAGPTAGTGFLVYQNAVHYHAHDNQSESTAQGMRPDLERGLRCHFAWMGLLAHLQICMVIL